MKNLVFDFNDTNEETSNRNGRAITRTLIENCAEKKKRKERETIIEGFHRESCQSD